jgi:hypothetical protein
MRDHGCDGSVLGEERAHAAMEDNPDLLSRRFPDIDETMRALVQVLGKEHAVDAVAGAPQILACKGSTILGAWKAMREVSTPCERTAGSSVGVRPSHRLAVLMHALTTPPPHAAPPHTSSLAHAKRKHSRLEHVHEPVAAPRLLPTSGWIRAEWLLLESKPRR